ncbi:unnamed protein product [Dicrocoelium dendriticum]|nr:unnamed protein product [Dicrocoelium dendriticum]
MQHISRLPQELCSKPEPLVVLSGLDTEGNQVHRSVWKAFTCNRGYDRDPLAFHCLPVDHQFPRPKLKPAGAQDWFLPKGILKTGWMRKHLENVPAVVAVFFTLDWAEPHWDERSSECARLVETVRSNLAGRESKLVLILIQTRALLPLGEDLNAMERAQALCSKCDLPGKNLFVLSHTNLLYGCITRLEGEFRDIAANYYHQRIKKIKMHKDSLNKSTHQLLFVRYEFKIAFFGELMQDTSLAMKHYQYAYNHLLEQRMLDIHALELKTVAAFINYKICRLAFQTNASDAISQFRKHIEFFSTFSGMPQLAFEHEAWMSKQFEILGDLFQEAIHLSLTALMTQHPGLYYQEAARHALARRQLSQVLCSQTYDPLSYSVDGNTHHAPSSFDADVLDSASTLRDDTDPISIVHSPVVESAVPKRIAVTKPVQLFRAQSPLRFVRRSTADGPAVADGCPPSPVTPAADISMSVSATEKVDGLEFYGQRPWRQAIQSIEPPNLIKEQQGILSLLKAEQLVDHSALIIPLLEQAHLHYTRYKAEHMKLYPLVLMGSEYYRKGDYEKALNCYSSVVNEYRAEKWWSIHTYISQYLLGCAYLTSHFDAFVSAALELIGPDSMLPVSHKNIVQRALFQLFQCRKLDSLSFVATVKQPIDVADEFSKSNLTPIGGPLASDSRVEDSLSAVSSSVDVTQNTSLDVSQLRICVECLATFTRPHFTVDRPVQLAVFLRSHARLPFQVRRVTVDLTHKCKSFPKKQHASEQHSSVYQTSQEWSSPFVLSPAEGVIVILFCLDPSTLGQHVKVDSVQVELTSTHACEHRTSATLVWRWPTSGEARTVPFSHTGGSALSSSEAHSSTTVRDLSIHFHFPSDLGLECQHEPTSVALSDNYMSLTFPELPAAWDLVRTRHQTEIRDLSSGLEMALIHTPPALSREIYTIGINVTNKASVVAGQISLSATLVELSIPSRKTDTEGTVSFTKLSVLPEPNPLSGIDVSAVVREEPKILNSHNNSVTDTLNLSDMIPNEQHLWPLYIRCTEPGQRNLRLQLTYQTRLSSPVVPDFLLSVDPESNKSRHSIRVLSVADHLVQRNRAESVYVENQCVETLLTDVNVVAPFSFACQITSIQQVPIADLVVGERFLLQLQLENTSTMDLELLSTSFQLSSAVTFVDCSPDVQIKDLTLEAGNLVGECQMLEANQATDSDNTVGLGSYLAHWCRRGSHSTDSVVTTRFQLPSVTVLKLPVVVRAEVPSTGTLLTPLPVYYSLDNQTICPRELIVHLEGSSDFMFSGQQKLRLRLLPGSPHVLHYVLLPLHVGYVPLPRMRLDFSDINSPTSDEQRSEKLHLEEKTLRQIPTHIFILPTAKQPTGIVRCTSSGTISNNPVSSSS